MYLVLFCAVLHSRLELRQKYIKDAKPQARGDLELLKDKLDDEMFSKLETYVNDLTGQRDQARNESISGRKGLKDKLATLETQQSDLMERLGIDSLDDLDELPDAKGAADAAKQFETKLKRMERQLADAEKQRDEVGGKYRDSLKSGVLSEALGAHDFVAKDVVSTFISNRLVWEGDDLLYKSDDGHLIPVKDGVAGIAKSRPELLKPTGAGGAGIRSTNARGNGEPLSMTRADFEALPPEKQMEAAKSGVTLQ